MLTTISILMFGIATDRVTFSGNIDAGVIVGVLVVTGIATIFRFVFGKMDTTDNGNPPPQ